MEKVWGPGKNWAETKSDQDKKWTIKLSPAIIQFEVWKLRHKSTGHWNVPTGFFKPLKMINFFHKYEFNRIMTILYWQVWWCLYVPLILLLVDNISESLNWTIFLKSNGVKFFFFLRPPHAGGQWLLTTVRVFYSGSVQLLYSVSYFKPHFVRLWAQFW